MHQPGSWGSTFWICGLDDVGYPLKCHVIYLKGFVEVFISRTQFRFGESIRSSMRVVIILIFSPLNPFLLMN